MFITRKKVTVFIWFTYKPALKLSGIVLKMASLIREGTLPGMKPPSPLVSKPPSKILIIPADEVVQVIAKVLTLFFVDGIKFICSCQCVRETTSAWCIDIIISLSLVFGVRTFLYTAITPQIQLNARDL